MLFHEYCRLKVLQKISPNKAERREFSDVIRTQRRRDHLFCLFSIRLFYGTARSDGLIETRNLVFSRHMLTVHLSRNNNIPEHG